VSVERLSAAQFEERLRELTSSLTQGANEDCVQCVRCFGCSRCTFCKESERLVGCHYSTRCRACTDCSHCTGCERLVACHHCVQTEDCTQGRYLVRCFGLSGCNYCFGCVGLSNKDFHILNEPVSRTDYFRITTELSRQLRLG
jgi:hypothetical protein